MSVRVVLLLALLPSSLLAIDCFRPNGDRVTDSSVQPCNRRNAEDAGGSMCCSLNRTSYPDQCLSNGLCGGGGNIFRDSCTDPTWKSPLCLNLCTQGFGESGTAIGVSEETTLDYSKSDVQVTDCNDGTYCCGPDNTTCCNRNEGIRIASILEPESSSSLTSTSTSLSASTTPTATPAAVTDGSATSVATDKEDTSGLDKKGKIAVGVCSAVIGAAVTAGLVWFFLVRKRRSKAPELDGANMHELPSKDPIHEKPNSFVRPELWEREPHAELDGTTKAELSG